MFIKLGNHKDVHYPVGSNIEAADSLATAMVKAIESFYKTPINLICQGSSGAILAALVGSKLKNMNKIIHIKKEGESSHCNGDVEFISSKDTNIIIDDFISSGDTVNRLYEQFKKKYDHVLHCLCVSRHISKDKLSFKHYYVFIGDTIA